MSVQLLIEWFVAILLLATGVSHMVQPRLWAQLFVDVLQKPYGGLFIGAMTLPLGLFVALGHNVWGLRPPVIVTIVGWGWTIKSTIYLLYPQALNKVATRHMERPHRFIPAGAVMALLGGAVIAYRLFMASAPITDITQ